MSGNCHRLNDPIWSKDHRRQTTETSQVSRHTHNTSQLQGTTKKKQKRERVPSHSKTLTQTFWSHTHTHTRTHTHTETHTDRHHAVEAHTHSTCSLTRSH